MMGIRALIIAMIYKWNILNKEFAKELITLYLSGCKEMANKSLEIYNPRKNGYRLYIDINIPEDVKSETCPTSFMLETLFSSMLKTRGTIVEIDKVDMFNTVLPIIEHDYEPLWEKLKFFELPEGKFKIRSLDTEDLINELKNKEKDFLLA